VAEDFEVRQGRRIFVPIEIDADGFAALGQAALDPPATGAYLKLRAGVVAPDDAGKRHLWVSMPFGRFYMDENLAPEAERAVWSGPRGRRDASVSVRIRNGVGVVEELYIDDSPIHEWLAKNAENR